MSLHNKAVSWVPASPAFTFRQMGSGLTTSCSVLCQESCEPETAQSQVKSLSIKFLKELCPAERVCRAGARLLMDSGCRDSSTSGPRRKFAERGREGEREAAVLRLIPENPQVGSCESSVGGVFWGRGRGSCLSFSFYEKEAACILGGRPDASLLVGSQGR